MNTRIIRYLIFLSAILPYTNCTILTQSDTEDEIIFGSDISLKTEYWRNVAAEPDLNKQDVLLSITRNYDIMEFDHPGPLLAYMLAVLTDPVTTEIADRISEELKYLKTTPERVNSINEYTSTHFTHTQTEAIFADIPWHDPWGLDLKSGSPRYKKLLPSEMKAMSVLTGKISGKCMTLAHLLTGIFYWLGCDQNDLMIFITQNSGYRHANAMLKYEDRLVITNNQYLALAGDYPNGSVPGPIPIIGIYNHEKSLNWKYTIRDSLSITAFSGSGSAMESFCQCYNISDQCATNPHSLKNLNDRQEVVGNIYKNSLVSNIAFMSKYAAQSLYVKHPEYYLQASLLCSGPKDLAESFLSTESLYSWMNTNLDSLSIFQESGDHIMTADQVLVFETGSIKDRAVFAFTILRHMSYDPVLYLGLNDAFIVVDSDTLSVKSLQKVENIPEEIIFGPLTV